MTRLPCDRKADVFAADADLPHLVALDAPFEVELADCFGRFPDRELPKWTGGANPITGPVALEGVDPGDTIAVEIRDIELVGEGFFGTDDDRTRVPIDHVAREAVFPPDLRLPLNPHVGTLGVLPAEGSVSTHDAGDHGGNMDCKLIDPGCTMFFRARVPGAGLGMGDVHAVMGDGEVGGQGVEAAAVAAVCVRRVRGLPIDRPYGVRQGIFFVVGWGDTMTVAADMAQADMLTVVREAAGLSERLATKFLGMAADLRVCWRGGNTPCLRMELPFAHLSTDAASAVQRKLGGTDE